MEKDFCFLSHPIIFFLFISWVSVIGVALGVLALTIVTSVINGFEGELARVITGMNGEVFFFTREGEPDRDPKKVEQSVRKVLPQAEAITASFLTELMLVGPSGVSGAVLQGVESDRIGTVTDLPRLIKAGRMSAFFKSKGSRNCFRFRIGRKTWC